MSKKEMNMEQVPPLDRENGAAVVRHDETGVLRYVYKNRELDMRSRVEMRAPHVLERDRKAKHIAETVLPPQEFVQLLTQDSEEIVQDYLLPKTAQ